MKTVLIVGGTGHIGKNMLRYFSEKQLNVKYTSRRLDENAIYLDLELLDLFDYSMVKDVEYIVFAAANLNAEACEKNEAEIRKINVTGTKKFIDKMLKLKKRVIYLSSDIVYGFNKHKIFDERSLPYPMSTYGRMKLEVEKCFEGNENFKSLRPAYVFSMEDKFAQYCRRCEEDNSIVEIYHPYYRNFITVFELCECIFYIINRWKECKFRILNVGGGGTN